MRRVSLATYATTWKESSLQPQASSVKAIDFAAIIDGIQNLGLKLEPAKADLPHRHRLVREFATVPLSKRGFRQIQLA